MLDHVKHVFPERRSWIKRVLLRASALDHAVAIEGSFVILP